METGLRTAMAETPMLTTSATASVSVPTLAMGRAMAGGKGTDMVQSSETTLLKHALEPRFAMLRCWEHEDCLEHPELALACANGMPIVWAAGVAEGPSEGTVQSGFATAQPYGDGFGHGVGNGDGFGAPQAGWRHGSGLGAGVSVNNQCVARAFELIIELDFESEYLRSWDDPAGHAYEFSWLHEGGW